MNPLHILLLVGALVVNIPWFMMIRRRGRISSHTRATLRSFHRQHASRTGSSKGEPYYRGAPTLKSHMRSGLLTKLQPHHLPLLFCYTCTLYILTRPDLGQKFHQVIATIFPTSATILSKSILPAWIRSHLPNDFPFAIPDSDDVRRSIQQIQSPVLQPQLLSQAGQALISILSMVTGLLLSYKSSSALGKWEKGKGVWIGAGAGSGGMSGGLRGEVRSAVRMISLIHNETEAEQADLQNPETKVDDPSEAADSSKQAQLHQRAGELPNIFRHCVGPMDGSDLRRRTAARIKRLAKATRYDQENWLEQEAKEKTNPRDQKCEFHLVQGHDPYLGHVAGTESLESEWRPPSNGQPSEPAGDGLPMETGTESLQNGAQQPEWTRQYRQLNVPIDSPAVLSGTLHAGNDILDSRTDGDADNQADTDPTHHIFSKQLDDTNRLTDGPLLKNLPPDTKRSSIPKRRTLQRSQVDGRPHPDLRRQPSAFSMPFPRNLPLSIIRLIESYANQFVSSESWTAAQGEKGYLLTRTLTKILSEAEMLSENPPPLSLSIHLTHLLLLYLLAIPAQLMPVLGKWTVPVALIAGWGLLGVEALSREVGAVFGTSENHIPTYLYCAEMLSETLDISPLFLEAYSGRVRDRLEGEGELTGRLDELIQKGDPRVLVLTRLYERRVDYWTPNFGTHAS
ncbi:hypothetical protein QFC21_001636 [Naganishia friedmannii]|uniref:Uncharacterized protein n=1 Tax=Naganishia friedmannii TaxID=89922 RepID=A0ACC2W214_9TREE|nr:hypothetical protein QFC21_001636 [Naganishia friedmannii]